jgi:hypothetical protein
MSKYKYWKHAERAVAQKLGGKRIVKKGIRSPDVSHPWLSIEVKSRHDIPLWLEQAITQSRINAEKGKLPVVVILTKERTPATPLIAMKLDDFIKWFIDKQTNTEGLPITINEAKK